MTCLRYNHNGNRNIEITLNLNRTENSLPKGFRKSDSFIHPAHRKKGPKQPHKSNQPRQTSFINRKRA